VLLVIPQLSLTRLSCPTAVAVFAAPAGAFAWWCLDPTVRHHIAPGLVADPNAVAEEEEA